MNRKVGSVIDQLALLMGSDEAMVSAELLCPPRDDVDGFFLYGAGNVGRKVAQALLEKNLKVKAFVDNNPILDGAIIDGIPVISPKLVEASGSDVCIVCIWSYGHSPKLTEQHAFSLGFSCVVHFAAAALAFDLKNILPNYAVAGTAPFAGPDILLRFERLVDMFEDETSRNILKKTMAFHYSPSFDLIPDVRSDALPFDPSAVKSYVDGGAYLGEDFKGKLKNFSGLASATLVEPDPATFHRLANQKFPSSIEVTLVNAALSSSAGSVMFSDTGDWGAKVLDPEAGCVGINVRSVTIDDLVGDLPGPIYVKMDLEGHEMEALRGSVDALARDDVIFSVTIEHKPLDIFEIPEFLFSFPGREIFLYTHDTEFRMDQVVYSVPSRLVYPT